jgi:hypothetical protein
MTEEEQQRLYVLRNAITPIPEHTKPSGPIKLIYTSVPERGLHLLYYAFERLSQKYDIELDVFSSYKIYGIPNADVQHRQLFDSLRNHPKINYYGTVTNEQVHKALQKAIKKFSPLGVFRKLDAVAKLSKRTVPDASRVFASDRDWVKQHFILKAI